MAGEVLELTRTQFLALLAGDERLKQRLAAGERMRAETPFVYPSRLGPVIINLGPRPPMELERGAPGEAAKEPAIRIDDGGLLVKMLSSQGMELEVDMFMSKTVFHAVRQQEGAGLKGSVVYVDSSAQTIDVDIWRFLQVVGEVIGLRHGKYKDALIQLDRRKDADAGIIGWRPT